MAALSEGRHISPDSALAQLFPGGLAAASRLLPWLARGSRPNLPMCAYAAIVDDPNLPFEANDLNRGRVRSGLVLHPGPDDIVRLHEEFRTTARDTVGGSADAFLDFAPPSGHSGRMEINVFEGTARCGGREVTLTNREFAVATVVALNRSGCNREEWCDKIWPGRDGASAAHLLKVYVHRIRSKFGTPDVIATHGGGYRLGSDVYVDVGALEALVRKHDADRMRLDTAQLRIVQRAFEGFKERRYLRLACLDGFSELERRLIASGTELARMLVEDAFFREDGLRALTVAEDLQSLDPYDDVAAELLIRAQLRLGRPDAAKRHFRAYCRSLRDELDLPPPEHLSLLFAQQ